MDGSAGVKDMGLSYNIDVPSRIAEVHDDQDTDKSVSMTSMAIDDILDYMSTEEEAIRFIKMILKFDYEAVYGFLEDND